LSTPLPETPRPEPRLTPGHDLITAGRALACDWRPATTTFQRVHDVICEADYKRRVAATGRVMQHAQIGYRDIGLTLEAMRRVVGTCADRGVTVDRFGVSLDWTMAHPARDRHTCTPGTGIVLQGAEDIARIADAGPAAAHFGDFMLGFTGSIDNACAAVAAGATSIGNLGQYYGFSVPGMDDDVAITEATVTALGLLAAQPVEILVHSNLNDGYGALFLDDASTAGMAMLDVYLVEELIGAKVSFCYGHQFADPLTRLAMLIALSRITATPGTMVYGNTLAYRATPAANYASLASYLLTDILGQRLVASGHAINPVPVTENIRIPDVDEIVEAQLFAARLADHAAGYAPLIDMAAADAVADRLIEGGRRFRDNVLAGLAEAGIDTRDPAQVMLAIRRYGARRLERLFGAGDPETGISGRRRPLVPAAWVADLDRDAAALVARHAAPARRLRVLIASTDIHEHGKYLVESALAHHDADLIDGGTRASPDGLADLAGIEAPDAVIVGTYNGIALSFAAALQAALSARGLQVPVLIGGRLNEVPANTNSSLPVDVTADIARTGAIPCADLDAMMVELARIGREAGPAGLYIDVDRDGIRV
jgi:methylmalonyl-CoA mutase cobalamin-binding subunit